MLFMVILVMNRKSYSNFVIVTSAMFIVINIIYQNITDR